MKTNPLRSALMLGPFCVFLIAGCGSDHAKEDAALTKAAARPKPGFVRLVNLTSEACKLLDHQRPATEAAAGGSSTPVPIGLKGDVVIQKASGSEIHVPV